MRRYIIYSLILHVLFFFILILISRNKNTIKINNQIVINVDLIEKVAQEEKNILIKQNEIKKEKKQELPKKIEKEKVVALRKKDIKKVKEEVPKVEKADSILNKKKPDIKEVAKEIKKGATVEQEDFKYNYYLTLIQTRIYRNFNPPSKIDTDDRTVIIYFKIEQDGSVSGLKFEKKSSKELLNRLAERAIKFSKFPPLPPEYVKKGYTYLGIHFTFIYE